ncbi:FAD-dependent oxidoreductase [Streptomyces sp. NPDC005236]|uniref:FAD-dependent oxidoreductase n=1 Tax=Streptomyces sp. NPDC005236 TaxID=3157028 RepID=UPI0033BF16A2
MIEEADVVVVGAGMFGSAAAKYASRAGADVLVIGRAPPHSRSTSPVCRRNRRPGR